jgi:hypothetical protein
MVEKLFSRHVLRSLVCFEKSMPRPRNGKMSFRKLIMSQWSLISCNARIIDEAAATRNACDIAKRRLRIRIECSSYRYVCRLCFSVNNNMRTRRNEASTMPRLSLARRQAPSRDSIGDFSSGCIIVASNTRSNTLRAKLSTYAERCRADE